MANFKNTNIESQYIEIVKNIYNKSTTRIKLEKIGTSFPVQKKIRQKLLLFLQNQDQEDRNDIINITTEFYNNLYIGSTINNSNTKTNCTESLSSLHIESIDYKEIIETMKKLKPDKSLGSDNITNDALKIDQNALLAPLVQLFKRILKTAETPLQWSESHIILLYKKEDPRDIGNL